MRPRLTPRRIIIAAILAFGSAGLIYLALNGDLNTFMHTVVNEETHSAVVVILYLLLPLIGFPITLFLLLLGVKFDIMSGVLVMTGGMAFHVALSFPAANTLLRPLIEKILSKSRYRLPDYSHRRFAMPAVIFMLVPGLSYIMKNYILSLSGIPFRAYFFIAWPTQAVMGIPVVVAGGLVQHRHLWLLLPLLILMAIGYFVFHRLRKRRGRIGP